MLYGIHALSAWGHKLPIAYVRVLGQATSSAHPYAEMEWVP